VESERNESPVADPSRMMVRMSNELKEELEKEFQRGT
jgi:hypothetical protein